MITIPLTKGHVAVVDDEDVHLAQFRWYAQPVRRTIYARRDDWAWRDGRPVRLRAHFLHRDVLAAVKGSEVDHINGDGLDCRRSNLRLASRAQNARNRRTSTTNKSGFKGVSWQAKRGKWQAMICVNNRNRFLGRFSDPVAAAEAYDAAARKHFGEFAALNFPPMRKA